MSHPSRPFLADLAYQEFCRYLDAPQPAFAALTTTQRLAWSMAVRLAVQEAHRVPCTMPLKVEGLPTKSPHHHPRVEKPQIREVYHQYVEEQRGQAEICETFHISASTFWRYVAAGKRAAA